jgi:ParB/RepB/Spo0J family partition protein
MTQTLETSNPDVAAWHRETLATDLPAPTLVQLFDLLEGAAPKGDRFRRGQLPRFLQVHNHYIVPGRWQPRTTFDEAALQELADDIERRGIINPLKVFVNRSGKFELIAGERRLKAARLAGVGLVPIEVIEGSADDIHEMSIIDNLQREDLKPLEEGEAYQRMFRELNISEAELARRLGKSRGHIQQRRALAAAAPVVREAIESGEINLTLARNIAMGTDNHKLQKKALTALKKRLNTGARTDEKHVREIVGDIVMKNAADKLKELGWNVKDGYVWGGSERPRQWEASEMTAAVNEQRRPPGEPPAPGEPTAEQEYMLQARYHDYYFKERSYAPWLVYSDRETYRATFYSAAEIPDLVMQIRRDLDDLQKRFGEQGWSLSLTEQGHFHVTHPNGRHNSLLNWSACENFLQRIIAGEEGTDKAADHRYQWECQHCHKRHMHPEVKYLKLGYQTVCQSCYDVAVQRTAELRDEIKQEHGMLIVRMDVDLLRRTLKRFHDAGDAISKVRGTSFENHRNRWQRLLKFDADQLREVYLDCLAEDAYTLEREEQAHGKLGGDDE